MLFLVTTILNPAPAQSELDPEMYLNCDIFCPNETEVINQIIYFSHFDTLYFVIPGTDSKANPLGPPTFKNNLHILHCCHI